MKTNAIDADALAETGAEFRALIASDADWIVRSQEDLHEFRDAGNNAHARVSDRDFHAFADSLEFKDGGVVTGSYRPLMASLTISEIFEVLESFGMSRRLSLETLENKCENGAWVFDFWSFCSSNCGSHIEGEDGW